MLRAEEIIGSVVRASYSYQTRAMAWTATVATKVVDNIDVLMKNQIPTDELFPAFFGVHPREDLGQVFPFRLNAYSAVNKISKQVEDSINDTL